MEENVFSQIDFGPLKEYLENDDITDISYSQSQVHLKTLSQGVYRVENPEINNTFMEKLAFQCANAMGKTFNMAHPMLDSESAELRMNFIHESISRNGISCVIRKTPAKIRLEKTKLLNEDYVTEDIHDFLITCVQGHCNIIVCGETGSGKTEFVKYLASKTKENEKIITIEDTLELHLDRIFPHRDIVTLKTNNIASYSDVLVACMRQNPIWILLSEVRSAEAVTAVRNSISSGHFILSTIHADKSASIPMRMYSLMETSQDVEQFLTTIYRYIQIGVCIRGRQDKTTKKFKREIADISEFYVDENNIPRSHLLYKKTADGRITRDNPTKYLIDYLDTQGIELPPINAGEYDPKKDEAPEMPKGTALKGAAMPKSDEEKVAKPEVKEETEVPTPVEAPKVVETPQPVEATQPVVTQEEKTTPEVIPPVETPKPQTIATPEVKKDELEPTVVASQEAKPQVQTPQPSVEQLKQVNNQSIDFNKFMPVTPAKPSVSPAPVVATPAVVTPTPVEQPKSTGFVVPKYAPVMPNGQPVQTPTPSVAAQTVPNQTTNVSVQPAAQVIAQPTAQIITKPVQNTAPVSSQPQVQAVKEPVVPQQVVEPVQAVQSAPVAQPTPVAPQPVQAAPAVGVNELNQMIANDING